MSFSISKTEKRSGITDPIPPLKIDIVLDNYVYQEFIEYFNKSMFVNLTIPDTYSSFKRIRMTFPCEGNEGDFYFTSPEDIERDLIIPAYNAGKFLFNITDNQDTISFVLDLSSGFINRL